MKIYPLKISLTELKRKTVSLKELSRDFTEEQKKIVETEKKYYLLTMKLRQARQAKGLTQTQLAQKARIPRTTITKIESGERNVTLHTLMSIAQAMGKRLEIRLT